MTGGGDSGYAAIYLAEPERRRITLQMKLAGFLVCVSLIGLGIYLLRQCSNRFMLLRHATSFTPYWYAIGGIFSLMLITLASVGAVLLFLASLH